jgi:spermidine synthase
VRLDELLSLLFYREDATGVTSVVELKPLARKYLVSNRLFAHNTSELGGLEDHRRLGQIPMLLHPQPQSVLAIGLGAGITLRGINDFHPASVDCVELSPGVVEAAKEQFDVENRHALENPAVKITVDDGRNFLAASAKKFDVVVLDIFFPMSSGSGNAFSREYYELCRQHLRPGGLVCQWLPVHQLSPANFKTVAATFQSVFPHTTLWYGMIGDDIAVVGLVGTETKFSIDEKNLASRMQNSGLSAELREVNLQSPALLLSHFVLGDDALAAFSRGQPLDTDDRPVIEFSAPRLAVQSSRQGMMNLLELSRMVGDASQLIVDSGTNNAALMDQLHRQQAGKKVIIEGFQFLLNDDPDGQRQFYQEALARDPDNEDLQSALRELSDEP